MKIAVLGNSHVGALRRGLELMNAADVPHDCVWFAARGRGLSHLALEGRTLVPKSENTASAITFTSGGARSVDIDAYDGFLLYGFVNAFVLESGRFYSRAVLDCAINDLAKNALSYKLIRYLRAVTSKPIYVGHRPLRAAPLRDVPQDLCAYTSGLQMLNETVYADVGAVMLPQPLESIVNGNRTRIDFTKGSKRLDLGDTNDGELHGANDISHMNDDFGRMWLTENLKKMESPGAFAKGVAHRFDVSRLANGLKRVRPVGRWLLKF